MFCIDECVKKNIICLYNFHTLIACLPPFVSGYFIYIRKCLRNYMYAFAGSKNSLSLTNKALTDTFVSILDDIHISFFVVSVC